MACCILAALIFAHIMAVLRRWGVFWGLVRPDEYDSPDTAMRRVRGWLARPRVRKALACLVAVEIVAFGGWVYTAHGTHFYRLGDEALAGLRGERVVYADGCGMDGRDYYVRLLLDSDGRVLRRDIVRARV